MNIILEGPDSTGKTTLAEKLKYRYGMKIINSTSKTRNDYAYHIDLLNYQENTVFDRFHVGEMVYPEIYNREGKISEEDFINITQRIIDNNDMLIILYSSNIEILNERLIARGELNYLAEIKQQNELFVKWAWVIQAMEYKNFIAIDISANNSYQNLDAWIDSHFNKKTFNIQFRKLCKDLLEYGEEVDTSETTRGNSKELINYCFRVDDLDNNVLTLKTRNTSYDYLAGETLWYWEGRNDVNFISKFGKMWTKLSDNKRTNNSAYGYILKKKHGFNQIEKIIELLKEQPTSRRAVININIPNKNVIKTKDEMCTICLNFQIRHNKLNCTAVMRSNDIIFGLTYDFTYFTLIQKYIAEQLKIEVGSYTHFAMSMHFYERDYQLIKDIAYGSLESRKDLFDVNELIRHKEKLIKFVDKKWKGKDEWHKLLKDNNVIRFEN